MNYAEHDTSCGSIRGRDYGEYLQYRGIQYATSKRWEYPVLITSWDGIYDATEYKDCSYQRRSFEDDALCNEFYHHEFRENLSFTYSENSLYLNIWSPKEPVNCPIILYIHGGSFTGGSSNEAHINGIEFAKSGIIFVSFNYRLGPFGFCSHPALSDENGTCGNYGLFDQYTAIQWIRNNIRSFGGNPERITLMGQSAGAMSVDIHSTSPLENGWFAGIVMSSGAALQRLLLRPRTPKQTTRFWNVVMAHAKVSTIEELRLTDPKTLYYAWYQACKDVKFSLPCTLPVYDGRLLTKETFHKRELADIPCILGMTSADMMPGILRRLIRKWMLISQQSNQNPCYSYLFSRNLPGDEKGAWHSSDLLYFFSTLKKNWRPFEEIDDQISNQMSHALIAFSNTGNPNCGELPRWSPGSKHTMNFCEHTSEIPWYTTRRKQQ